MKKTLTQFLALSGILLLMFTSCKKDETKVYSSLGTSGSITASTTSPTLAKSTSTNTAVTFNLSTTTPVSGYQTAVTYTLQIDKKGNNFALPQTVSATSGTTTMTQGDLNSVLHSLNLKDGEQTQVEVREKSSFAANADPAYSNVLTLTVTPYSLVSYVYLPGDYQGWDPTAATVDSLASATSNGIYTGSVTFSSAASFKVTTGRSWNVNYGGTGTSGTLVSNGDNFSLAAGSYTMTVNINSLTFSFTKK